MKKTSLPLGCVFACQGVIIFTSAVLSVCVHVLVILKYFFSYAYVYRQTVLVKIFIPCQGVFFCLSLPNVELFTLAFQQSIKTCIFIVFSMKIHPGCAARALPSHSRRGLRAPDPADQGSSFLLLPTQLSLTESCLNK